MRNTHAALTWITQLLEGACVPFEIDGGLAAHVYGAQRELADIDINISHTHFDAVVAKVHDYLTFGPAWYMDHYWRTYMVTLEYAGQQIDLCALGHMSLFDHETQTWIDVSDDLSDVRRLPFEGRELPFINETKLLRYKLDLHRGVDRKDVHGMKDHLRHEWL